MATSVFKPVRAPRPTAPATQKATRPSAAIPQYLIDEAKAVAPTTFDAAKHLNYQQPANIVTMREIGLDGQGVSPHAVSDPFPLFTQDAILQMRREIFSEKVLDECQYTSTFIKNMVRGMNHERAPFTYDAWNSPELVSKISEVAGIEVVPHIDFDIANINITWNGQTTEIVKDTSADPLGDGASAVAWHYDSFPFVCVVMLSDCTDMVGGETALRLPSGEIKKVRGPSMGTAVVMQGRYIEHQALKALGGRERISMVTCFRPKNPLVKDETVLVGVRGTSILPQLYDQYVEYRLDILEERIRHRAKAERKRREKHKSIEVDDLRRFITEQREFLDDMLDELI